MPGSNRSDPEEAEGEESYDVCCKEIPERWFDSILFISILEMWFYSLLVFSDHFHCKHTDETDIVSNLCSTHLGMTDKLDFLEGEKTGKDSSQAPKKALNKKG